MSQNCRVYFEQMDNGIPCEAFYDAEKTTDGTIILHSWGMIVNRTQSPDKHNPTKIGGEVQQPAFLLEIIQEKLPNTVFCEIPHDGRFNEYQTELTPKQ